MPLNVCVPVCVYCVYYMCAHLREKKRKIHPGASYSWLREHTQNNTQTCTQTTTHAKSPPGGRDVIPPAETAVDQSGVEVEWHSITEGQRSQEHTHWDADVCLLQSNTRRLCRYMRTTFFSLDISHEPKNQWWRQLQGTQPWRSQTNSLPHSICAVHAVYLSTYEESNTRRNR